MSFKCFRFSSNVNFVLYSIYSNQRPFVFSKQQEEKCREISSMSLAGLKYRTYAHPVPDVVTYEFYECFSFHQNTIVHTIN